MEVIKKSNPFTYKAGIILMIETGEYSDYQVEGLYKVLINFTDEQSILFFKAEHQEEIEKSEFNFDFDQQQEFIKYLIENKYIEEVDYKPFHIGSYGRLELE